MIDVTNEDREPVGWVDSKACYDDKELTAALLDYNNRLRRETEEWNASVAGAFGRLPSETYTPKWAKDHIWANILEIRRLSESKPTVAQAVARLLVPAVRLVEWAKLVAGAAVDIWSDAMECERWIRRAEESREQRQFEINAHDIHEFIKREKKNGGES
jgi:hypothetical protein